MLLLSVTVLRAVAVDAVMRTLTRAELLGIALIVSVVVHGVQAKRIVLVCSELLGKLILLASYATELSHLVLLLLRGFDLELHLLNILVLHHEFLVFDGLLMLCSHLKLLPHKKLLLMTLSTLLRLHL